MFIQPNPFPVNPALFDKETIKITKAGKNGTLVVTILDESSSMGSCWDATISGYNEFITGQKSQDLGECKLTAVKFSGYSVDTIFENCDIKDVPEINKDTYCPNGSTNLLDAIGESIEKINNALSKNKKKDRPSVMIMIMTDGEENTSRKYNNARIKELVQECQSKNWVFMFLGANIDAFAAGSSIGISGSAVAQYSTGNMKETMLNVGASTARYRSAVANDSLDSYANESLFTDSERAQMK